MNKDTLKFKNTYLMVALVKNCPTVSYQDYTLHPPPSLYKVQEYLSQLQIALILLKLKLSSCTNY